MKTYQVSGNVCLSFSISMLAESAEEAEAFIKENGIPEDMWAGEDIDIWEVAEIV